MIRDNIYAEIILSINRALLGDVNPSLRGVAFEWNPLEEEIIVFFYHDGELSDALMNHYDCIDFEASADFFLEEDSIKLIKNDFKIVSAKYPTPLPDHDHWVYRRKEPFVDPK